MKRIISILIVVCLCLTILGSFAEELVTISFDAEQYSVPVGKTVSLKATMTPKKKAKLEWSSSDESIATVSGKGAVKGISVGETTITVKSADDDSLTASCTVSVVLPVKKIVLAEKKLSLPEGVSQKLDVAVEPEDATNKSLVFTSSKESVATVDEDGVVTGVSKGSAKITVTSQDGSKVKAVVNVKVDKYDMVFTSPEPQTTQYYYGSGQFTVKGKVKTGCVSIPDITTSMWAMVAGGPASQDFEVTPVKPGTDTITVKAGRMKTVITVYVSPDCFKEDAKTEEQEPEDI